MTSTTPQTAYLSGDALKHVRLAFNGVGANAKAKVNRYLPKRETETQDSTKTAAAAPAAPSPTTPAKPPPAAPKPPVWSAHGSQVENPHQAWYSRTLNEHLRNDLMPRRGWTPEVQAQRPEDYEKAYGAARSAILEDPESLQRLHARINWNRRAKAEQRASGTGNTAEAAGLSGSIAVPAALAHSARLAASPWKALAAQTAGVVAPIQAGTAADALGAGSHAGHDDRAADFHADQKARLDWLREQQGPEFQHVLKQYENAPAATQTAEQYAQSVSDAAGKNAGVTSLGDVGAMALSGVPTKAVQAGLTAARFAPIAGGAAVLPVANAAIGTGSQIADIAESPNAYEDQLAARFASQQRARSGSWGAQLGQAVSDLSAPFRGDVNQLAAMAQNDLQNAGVPKAVDAVVRGLNAATNPTGPVTPDEIRQARSRYALARLQRLYEQDPSNPEVQEYIRAHQ